MKKAFKLTIISFILCLCFAFSGCNILTIYVPDDDDSGLGNGSSTETYESKITEDMITDTYGKIYAVDSVDFKESQGEDLTAIQATEKVYESVVNVKAYTGTSTHLGAGVMIDLTLDYQDDLLDSKPFVYVVTCFHVIENAGEIIVYIPNKVEDQSLNGKYEYYNIAYGATLLGGDKDSDIALLRFEINSTYSQSYGIDTSNYAQKLTFSQISKNNLVRGQDIFAIGCPTGELPGSVSYGKVSNLFVPVQVEDIGEMCLHQTDTATNEGNSGGGIFNYLGQLVGILNAGASDYDGISFFIPVLGSTGIFDVATNLLINMTDGKQGFIQGKWKFNAVFVQSENGGGLYVRDVQKDGSLGMAGICDNDYIFAVSYGENGGEFTTIAQFDAIYKQMQKELVAGDSVTVTYGYYDRFGGRKEYSVPVILVQYVYVPPVL